MRRRPYNKMPPVEQEIPMEVNLPAEVIRESLDECVDVNPFDALILYPLLCTHKQSSRAAYDLVERLKDICPFLEPEQRRSIIRLIRMNDSLGRMGENIAQDYAMYRNDRPMTHMERQRGIIRVLSRSGETRGLNNMENMMDKIFTMQSMMQGTRGSNNPMDMMSLLGPLMNINGSGIGQMMNMMSMMGNMNFS
jgi:hypothetical protein